VVASAGIPGNVEAIVIPVFPGRSLPPLADNERVVQPVRLASDTGHWTFSGGRQAGAAAFTGVRPYHPERLFP